MAGLSREKGDGWKEMAGNQSPSVCLLLVSTGSLTGAGNSQGREAGAELQAPSRRCWGSGFSRQANGTVAKGGGGPGRLDRDEKAFFNEKGPRPCQPLLLSVCCPLLAGFLVQVAAARER